jgi:hypothetical protein
MTMADPIREALESLVKAWEALPAGNYSGEAGFARIRNWLSLQMKPAVDGARQALSLLTAKASDVDVEAMGEALCNLSDSLRSAGLFGAGNEKNELFVARYERVVSEWNKLTAAISSMPTIADEGERARDEKIERRLNWAREDTYEGYIYERERKSPRRDEWVTLRASDFDYLRALQSSASASVGEG